MIAEQPGRRFLAPMPYPGAPGAPYLSGNNVTKFLQRFRLIYKEYDIQNEGMFQQLLWYCEKTIGDYVKSIPEYISRDGPGLFKIMRKDHRKYDLDQQVNSRNFLETLKSRPRTEKDDLKQYCRQFHTISHTIVERGQLEKYTRAMWFIQGLPPKTREKLVRKVGCDTEDASTMDYIKIYGVTSTIADTAYFLEGFSVSNEEYKELSSLADNYQSKVTLNPAERYTPPVSKPVPSADTEGIRTVTKTLEALTLLHQVMANHMAVTRGPMDGAAAGAPDANSTAPGMRPAWATAGPEMARCNDCYYCGGSHRRYVCPDFNATCARGEIHIDGDHRLCLGRSGDGNAPLSVP